MRSLLWLIPALPLAGFVLLGLTGRRMPRAAAGAVGVGSIGLATALALAVAAQHLAAPPPDGVHVQALWQWIEVGGFRAAVALRLDALSLVMTLVVCGVGFLIHLYASEYMQEDAGYSRFFAYLNLFVASMLVLVLADGLLLLFLGWEGVGLCSYLLIGFWYRDPANGRAARKAFVVTRVGDTAFAIGLFLIFAQLGTLEIEPVLERARASWPIGSAPAVAAAALVLAGAVGKSAQLPLQTWLPDAMAGPTPVSALIHAATMVTAGVYLIARLHPLFELAPAVLLAVAVVGAATLLLAGLAALTQRDIKRVLAYSTVSQIGYMFLALGVGAWSAAIFHLMTHAFFKALLFLAAGVVIHALDEEHDLFHMGGLRRKLPLAYGSFLVGALSLAGLPLVTAGFYSKDRILFAAAGSAQGAGALWAAGLAGVVLTGLYIFRELFLIFFGEQTTPPGPRRPGWRIRVPLLVLAVLSIIGGVIKVPRALGGGVELLSGILQQTLPVTEPHAAPGTEAVLLVLSSLASLGGIALAWQWYERRPRRVRGEVRTPGVPEPVERFWLSGFGFDRLYDALFVRPYLALARAARSDAVDAFFEGIAALVRAGHAAVRRSQTGVLRWYAAGLAAGTIVFIAMVLFR